ncbi:MAG: DUF4469 domain-containing protein [Treponema sp.]|jgi:hypothetical protein|nr:DUF4469 domain-containing protein [Treponema sp.]
MALDFTVKDIIHQVIAKFVPNHLPNAVKPYHLKCVFQPELDVHSIASKADVYNIETDPKVIEEGFNTACALIYHLTADGYLIKTPLYNSRLRLPGEYEGAETALGEGLRPEIRFQAAAGFRKYIGETVRVEFDGIEDTDGLIAEALDEKTGQMDEVMTIGNLLTIRGYGLKIEGDEAHKAQMGLFFQPASGVPPKAEIIAVNENRTLKVIVPPGLTPGASYTLWIFAMSSASGGSTLLKTVREEAAHPCAANPKIIANLLQMFRRFMTYGQKNCQNYS